MSWRGILPYIVIAVASFSVLPGCSKGPWKAQIVDSETGQPQQGVVVLAYWIKSEASLGGWGGGGFYDSEEVVTGPDGRFVIHSRWSYTIPGVTKVSGPEWAIFKPGYGQWRFREAAENFAKGQEAVIELPPLKTRKERLKFYKGVGWTPSGVVPPERKKHFRDAVNMERAYLGFRN